MGPPWTEAPTPSAWPPAPPPQGTRRFFSGCLTAGWGREARERANVMARKFMGAGFRPGERILLTADTWPGFFDVFFGAQYAGLLAVPVSIPLGIGGKEAYLDQLRRQLDASGAVAAFGID